MQAPRYGERTARHAVVSRLRVTARDVEVSAQEIDADVVTAKGGHRGAGRHL